MKLIRNKPTAEGRELGEMIASMTDKSEIEVRKKFPDHSERCRSCAFRRGSFPNGCASTLMDAIKCVAELEPFYCHENVDRHGKPTELCAGWLIATTDMPEELKNRLKNKTIDWEYSFADLPAEQ